MPVMCLLFWRWAIGMAQFYLHSLDNACVYSAAIFKNRAMNLLRFLSKSGLLGQPNSRKGA